MTDTREPDALSDRLLARARAAVADKTERGIYTPEFRALLAEPLDVRPDPAFAAGPAWPEVVRTVAVDPEPPIVSTRPVIGPAVRILKKVVRRSLRWYLTPVTAQVTTHNRAVVEALEEHSREIIRLRREVDGLRSRLAAHDGESGGATRRA